MSQQKTLVSKSGSLKLVYVNGIVEFYADGTMLGIEDEEHVLERLDSMACNVESNFVFLDILSVIYQIDKDYIFNKTESTME
jgi:hypothetical protein